MLNYFCKMALSPWQLKQKTVLALNCKEYQNTFIKGGEKFVWGDKKVMDYQTFHLKRMHWYCGNTVVAEVHRNSILSTS